MFQASEGRNCAEVDAGNGYREFEFMEEDGEEEEEKEEKEEETGEGEDKDEVEKDKDKAEGDERSCLLSISTSSTSIRNAPMSLFRKVTSSYLSSSPPISPSFSSASSSIPLVFSSMLLS